MASLQSPSRGHSHGAGVNRLLKLRKDKEDRVLNRIVHACDVTTAPSTVSV